METDRAGDPTRRRGQLERDAARQPREGRQPRAELLVPTGKWKLGRRLVQKRQPTLVPHLL